MKNRYFPEEDIQSDDLLFVCYMIERIARKLHQKNRYVVNTIGKDAMEHLLSVANVLHAENPLDVEDDWIREYRFQNGSFDILDVEKELVSQIPTALQMGKVYHRLIKDTALSDENYVEGIFRVYNHEICDVIDNYNCSAYFEPSYVIARAYQAGGFRVRIGRGCDAALCVSFDEEGQMCGNLFCRREYFARFPLKIVKSFECVLALRYGIVINELFLCKSIYFHKMD